MSAASDLTLPTNRTHRLQMLATLAVSRLRGVPCDLWQEGGSADPRPRNPGRERQIRRASADSEKFGVWRHVSPERRYLSPDIEAVKRPI